MTQNISSRVTRFLSGEDCRAYSWLGSHRLDDTFVFRVFAPHAARVFLVGDFNGWGESHPMTSLSGGVWEAELSASLLEKSAIYKYKIYDRRGEGFFRSDPYAFGMDVPPHCASVACDVGGFKWSDSGWMAQRAENSCIGVSAQPINVYELHAGSWLRREDGSFISYHALADELAPYLKQMGYTHVQLLPVAAHPYYGSCGFRTGGYFAPDGRLGSPREFMEFVNTMHGAGVGVILDVNFSTFTRDEFGLGRFDGERLYEREDDGSDVYVFDTEREHVVSFLASNAIFWLEEYHVDGLHFCDTFRILGGQAENEGARRLLKAINRAVKETDGSVITTADSRSADGLGFDLLWDADRTENFLACASSPIDSRSALSDAWTCGANGGMITISHDRVSGRNKSYLDRLPGDYLQRFAGARAFEALRMTLPGKKLSFMGCEIGQFRRWEHERAVEWFLLDYESHRRFQQFISDLNVFYLSRPELWQKEGEGGIKVTDCGEARRGVVAFERIDENSHRLVVVANLSSKTASNYFLPVSERGEYLEVLNTDCRTYGGHGDYCFKAVSTVVSPMAKTDKNQGFALPLNLPPLSVRIFKLVEKKSDGEGRGGSPKRRGIGKLPPPGKKIFL